jgi:UDP-galactopyranose mutase
MNEVLQSEVRQRLAGIPAFFCGRLATYTYIDQDQAIGQALACASEVRRTLGV